jgi:hypothetical protein
MLAWVIALHSPLQYLIPNTHFPRPSNLQNSYIIGTAIALAALLAWQLRGRQATANRRSVQVAIVTIVEWLFWLALAPLMPATLWFGCFFLLQHSREHFNALAKNGYLGADDIFFAILALAALALVAGYFRSQIAAWPDVFGPEHRKTLEASLALWIAPALLGLTVAHSALIDGMKPLAKI